MTYWIFKVAQQELYSDVSGKSYEYDNTYSVRVAPKDVFLYLSKNREYSFTATGIVRKLTTREPTKKEAERTAKIHTVYTAHLAEVVWFKETISISSGTEEGRKNRAKLGIVDVNLLGWSQSIALLDEEMYQAILDLVEARDAIPSVDGTDSSVPDSWSKRRIRGAVRKFSRPVLERSNSRCVVCGAALEGLIDAAHLSPYASDRKNRANPANGIGLCKFCHRALDLRLIAIEPNGNLLVAPFIQDAIAIHHFSRIDSKQRARWLEGVDPTFLELTVRWFKDSMPQRVT